MSCHEEKVSQFIDSLNEERKPAEDEYSTDSPELKVLYQTVKKVRTLKEPAMPDKDFPEKLAKLAKREIHGGTVKRNRRWAKAAVIAAAAALLAIAVNILGPMQSNGIVQAMEKAFKEVQAYHGILNIVETNEQGDSVTQARLEVWADKDGHYYTKGLEGAYKGIVTVHNGERKWQIHPDQKEIHILDVFPDTHRFVFEIGTEINQVKNALTVKEKGEERVAGREAIVLEVVPEGGEAYKIWVDKETKLPLQKETPFRNAIHYTITYTELEIAEGGIPENLLAFHVPPGYKESNLHPEQAVTSLKEAEDIAGFPIIRQGDLRGMYEQEKITVVKNEIIKIYYKGLLNRGKLVFIQGKAKDDFKIANTALKGKMAGLEIELQMPLEMDTGILSGGGPYAGETAFGSIRWQEGDFEFAVIGDVSLEELIFFTERLTNKKIEIPSMFFVPEIEVPVDMEAEENAQKNVDAGSSPWRLDPLYSAQVFVSLKISPGGIEGVYPVKLTDLKILQNDGTTAVIQVRAKNSPVEKVYLKKLVRQDSSGIWTVVGYDPSGNGGE